jgi:2-keto-4-pentenoate hydratase/2-oxohepta-3-ene-1,7-dioic acid hydratase in catechol pathway
MNLCRFIAKDGPGPRYGLIENGVISPMIDADAFSGRGRTQTGRYHLGDVRLLAPAEPSKIVCVGRNYLKHAKELGNEMPSEPLLFLKPPSSVIGPNDPIVLPEQSQQVEHEAELAVVIGRTAHQIAEGDNPLSYVLGFTCLNDVTARDLQRKDVQFTRAKSFDTFCPMGPWLMTDLNVADVQVTCRVNGAEKQSGRTSEMAFPVDLLIRYISRVMTLYPGDVIATGTPAGVSQLRHGDTVEVEIEGIGVLSNPIVDGTSAR